MDDNKLCTRILTKKSGLNSDTEELGRRPLYSGIEKTILNQAEGGIDQRRALWNNVAFMNLVQELIPSSTDRPSELAYDNGWSNFLEVAKILKPKMCIKFGIEGLGRLGYLLNNRETGWTRDNVQEFYVKPYAINLTNEDHNMRIIVCYHPSARPFYYEEWAQHIERYFPEVKSLFRS
jgi:hypothetical protein